MSLPWRVKFEPPKMQALRARITELEAKLAEAEVVLRIAREAIETLPPEALGSGWTPEGQEYPLRAGRGGDLNLIEALQEANNKSRQFLSELDETAELLGGENNSGVALSRAVTVALIQQTEAAIASGDILRMLVAAEVHGLNTGEADSTQPPAPGAGESEHQNMKLSKPWRATAVLLCLIYSGGAALLLFDYLRPGQLQEWAWQITESPK